MKFVNDLVNKTAQSSQIGIILINNDTYYIQLIRLIK